MGELLLMCTEGLRFMISILAKVTVAPAVSRTPTAEMMPKNISISSSVWIRLLVVVTANRIPDGGFQGNKPHVGNAPLN